ncbi:helix-turn-helix transcriptional regulator [Paenibacillus sp. FSL E2-0177]|uniref:helix-turn-helix domain-containing protein n=1 Tax=Paenibacillus sp. FSL E2-0177 TaxID=2921360 RepID=UPI0030EEE0D0
MIMFRGSHLRKLRKTAGLTMKEFGAIFSLAESTISGYENESRKPDLVTLDKFASFFNVSADYLMGRSEVPLIGEPGKYTEDELEVIEDALRRYREMKRKLIYQIKNNE